MPTPPPNELPPSREDALAAAAALVNSTRGGPAPVSVLLSLSQQTINARDTAASWAKAQIGRLWQAVNPYSDDQVLDFASQSAQVMKTAQDSAGRAAAVAQSLQIRSLGVNISDPDPSLPLNVRAPGATIADGAITLHTRAVDVEYGDDATARVTPEDMTTQAVFQRPAETFRWVAAEGNKSGLRWIDDAKAQSGLRISTLVDDNLMLAQRIAQQETIAQAVDLDRAGPTIVGYRRVIHPELSRTGTCGLCIAASNQLYHVAELMPIHKNCKCTIAAVTEDHDPADEANAVDLKALYKGAGGTSSADLKKTRYKIGDHGELGPVLARNSDDEPLHSTGAPPEPEPVAEPAPEPEAPTTAGGGGNEPPTDPPTPGIAEPDEPDEPRLNDMFAAQSNAAGIAVRESLRRWQNPDRYYGQVQAAAEGADATDEAVQVYSDLDDLAVPLPEDVQVWRGIRSIDDTFGAPIDDLVGQPDRIVDRFTATTIHQQVAQDEFTRPARNPALIKVTARAGTKAVWVPPLGSPEMADQGELLFTPGHQLSILRVDTTAEVPVIEVEVRQP